MDLFCTLILRNYIAFDKPLSPPVFKKKNYGFAVNMAALVVLEIYTIMLTEQTTSSPITCISDLKRLFDPGYNLWAF
jgi:hypothetical protein